MRSQATNSLTGMASAKPLFSQTKMTGSFQIAARFSASWNEPVFDAPSPNMHMQIRSEPCCFIAMATPVAIGRLLPTTDPQ